MRFVEDEDPTRIDLSTDPLSRRFRGVAYHGNTPFDVPFISEIVPGFYQGGCEQGLVLPENIKNVISLYPWEQYEINHDADRVEHRLYDSADEPDMEGIVAIAEAVNEARKSGDTLVHCQAGLNRSGLVAGVALVLDGMSPQEALDTLRESRSDAVLCNKTFERALLNFKPEEWLV